jgi:hypothetical protein
MLELQSIAGDRTLWCRHEFKYLISEAQAAAVTEYIRPLMRMDRHGEFKEDGSYPISSLYMDSDDLKLCRETIEGKHTRFKLRIRSYNDEPEYPKFFEIKRRINRIIVKSRARVMENSVGPLIAGLDRPPMGKGEEQQALEQFLYYMTYIDAKPLVRVRYMRQAFEDPLENTVRITFDRDLCGNITQTPDLSLNGDGWYRIPMHNYVIMEVKFTGRFPAWVTRMIKFFGLKQQSVSKFALCVQQALNIGYCAPKRNIGRFTWNISGRL